MDIKSVADMTSKEFEVHCLKILKSYAEKEGLKDFSITHNKIIPTTDGDYQIDVYAEFTAMGVTIKALCECKHYSKQVERKVVAELHDKLESTRTHKGIVMSTSGFQSGAIQYANAHGIALIKVSDRDYTHLSHSAGKESEIEDDPFMYDITHLPSIEAFLLEDESKEPLQIYPTKQMIRTVQIEMNQRIEQLTGLKLPFPREGEKENV